MIEDLLGVKVLDKNGELHTYKGNIVDEINRQGCTLHKLDKTPVKVIAHYSYYQWVRDIR